MTENSLSDQEKQLLHHEEFIAELLNKRRQEKEQKEHWFLRFLNSSVAVAMITIVGGAYVTNRVAGMIQARNKEHEMSLVAYKEHLDRRRETVERAHELVGACLSASRGLIALTEEEFQLNKFVGIEQDRVRTQRASLRSDYNVVAARWTGEKQKVSLLVSYYFGGQREATNAWQEVDKSVTNHLSCAREWYSDYSKRKKAVSSEDASKACDAEREDVGKGLVQLGQALNSASDHLWQRFK